MIGIDDIVFTRLKTQGVSKLISKYPEINFTTDNRVRNISKFPTVYVHALQTAERGQDLEGKTINAGYFTFQIEVFDNQSQKRAKEVFETIILIMKSMRFEVNLPEMDNTDDFYRCVSRCSRIIGSGDIL